MYQAIFRAGLFSSLLAACGVSPPTCPAVAASATETVALHCRPLMPLAQSYPDDDEGYSVRLFRTLLANEQGETVFHMVRTQDGPELSIQVVDYGRSQFGLVSRRLVDENSDESAAESWQTAIDAESAGRLNELWTTALRATRIVPGFDGFNRPEFFFTGVVESLRVTGEAIGPRQGSCLAALAVVGEQLYEIPRLVPAERALALRRLETDVAQLQARFDQAGWRKAVLVH